MAIFNLGPNQDDFPGKNDDNKGDDVITGNADDDELDGGPGDDQIFGGEDDDILKGGSGKDMLDGGDDDDELYGEAGDDWLRGGKGIDLIHGGPGMDVANYYESDAPVTVTLDGQTEDAEGVPNGDAEGEGGTAEGDQLFGIENLQGSMYGDMLTGDDQGERPVRLAGQRHHRGRRGGNDKLRGHMGDDTIDGGDG